MSRLSRAMGTRTSMEKFDLTWAFYETRSDEGTLFGSMGVSSDEWSARREELFRRFVRPN
jgi:hypothetical protein